MTAAARVENAVKEYGAGDTRVRALDGVSVEFAAARFTAVMGPSGSGKSTLMLPQPGGWEVPPSPPGWTPSAAAGPGSATPSCPPSATGS